MQQKLQFTAVCTGAYFLLFVPLPCYSWQNHFESFQDVFRTREQLGRFPSSLAISNHKVVTKMECLDTCLRSPYSASFQMKKRSSGSRRGRYWPCIINRQESQMLELKGQDRTKWIHFNVSSQELQQVSTHLLGCAVHARNSEMFVYVSCLSAVWELPSRKVTLIWHINIFLFIFKIIVLLTFKCLYGLAALAPNYLIERVTISRQARYSPRSTDYLDY